MRRKGKEDDNGEIGRKYFPWNYDLDQVLVQCINILAEDKKIDAKEKFTSGAYKELERLMEQERPRCGLKADPNIISRCKTLKAKFLALQELRGFSGWDDTKKMVILDETSYADYVAKHSHCAKLNRVPFPSYDGLAKVFDKVRATGESAIGMEELENGCPIIEVQKNLVLGWKNTHFGDDESSLSTPMDKRAREQSTPPTPTTDDQSNPPSSVDKDTPSEAIPPEATNRAKKTRHLSSQVGSEIAELKPMILKKINSLESMVEEANTVHKQRSMLYQELRKVEGLTDKQIWAATVSLGKDGSMLEIFFNLEGEDRKKFIHCLLR
ncbi:hypothetical protein LINPERHAP2_LOCUS29929 [Linum perenne]